MKVLVVGGAGYIGGVVTDALMKKNIPFTVYDNLMYEHQYLKPVDFIYGDVRDMAKLKEILPHYTHVIWLAAIVGDGACQVNPPVTLAVNQESVKWLAEHYDGRIIFASTCSVYGKNDSMVTESSPLSPLSLYAKTKVEAEKYLQGKNSLIFRLGTVFGVSDAHSRLRMDLVVNYMTGDALTKGKLSVWGGSQWRPFVHAKDVGETMVNNLDRPVRGIYNLATANIQIKELAAMVSKITGCKVEYTPQQIGDQRDYHVMTDKAVKDGIFNPSTMRTIEDGVRELMGFIKDGRIKYVENTVYFNERYALSLMKNGEFT